MDRYILYAMGILPFTVPMIAGVLSALFMNEKNRIFLTVVYYIMFALSVISFLWILLVFLFIILLDWGFSVIFSPVALISAIAVQLVLMKRFSDSVKVRKVIRLTLMATPLFVLILMFLIAGVFGIDIRLAM
ncbi:MAG: hypothetical protein FWD39_06140 [Clostridiales bacterium]|nr:hypothetical protein [Clostridiales bacterium]